MRLSCSFVRLSRIVATPGWHQGPVEEGWGDGRDRLARVLHTLRMRGTFYCHAELGEPWALEMPAISDSVSFHVVTSGVCWLRLPDAEPVELRAGDLAFVPHGWATTCSANPMLDEVPGSTCSHSTTSVVITRCSVMGEWAAAPS